MHTQFMQNIWQFDSNIVEPKITLEIVFLIVLLLFFLHAYSLNQTDNATKIPNIGTKPTSNGNGINNSMKLNNNSSNGSINETNGKPLNVDEVSAFSWKHLFLFLVNKSIYTVRL